MMATILYVKSMFVWHKKMSHFKITNTSGKAISLRVQKPGKDVWEELILLPGIMMEIPGLAGAHVSFGCAVDISFREQVKKLVGSGVKKTMYKGVQSLDLPSDFVLLKIKELVA